MQGDKHHGGVPTDHWHKFRDPELAFAAKYAHNGRVTMMGAWDLEEGSGSGGSTKYIPRGHGTTTNAAPTSYFSFKDYGAKGDGTTDDTSAISETFAAAQGTISAGVPGGAVYIPSGEYVISSTITITRFSGLIYGDGEGQSPAYAASPGNGSVIRWAGNNSTPMFEFIDSEYIVGRDFRLEGSNTNTPTYGFQMQNNGGTLGCNHRLTFRNVFIGQYPWSSQGTNQGNVQSCVGYTGTNGNNDQFLFDKCVFSYPTAYGFYAPNSQSVWGNLRDCVFDNCATTGLYTGADITLVNPTFNSCGIDIQTVTANAPNVQVFGWYSEHTGQMFNISPDTKLVVHGGTVQCGTVQSGGGVLGAAFPSNNQTIDIQDVTFTGMSTPADVTITWGPQSSSYVGRVLIRVVNCRGIQSGQLVFSGSMWASSPNSRATIEWITWDGIDWSGTKNLYEFRNEMANNGAGTRTTQNTSAWDLPPSFTPVITPSPINLVQTVASNPGNVASFTMTLPRAPTPGNFMAVAIVIDSATATVSSVASTGDTWHQGPAVSSGGFRCELWYAYNIAGTSDAAILVTPSTSKFCSGWAWEFSGVLSVSTPLDQSGTSINTLTVPGTALTPSVAGELWIVAAGNNGVISAPSLYTDNGSQIMTAALTGDAGFLLESGTSAQQPAFYGTTNGSACAIASFQP